MPHLCGETDPVHGVSTSLLELAVSHYNALRATDPIDDDENCDWSQTQLDAPQFATTGRLSSAPFHQKSSRQSQGEFIVETRSRKDGMSSTVSGPCRCTIATCPPSASPRESKATPFHPVHSQRRCTTCIQRKLKCDGSNPQVGGECTSCTEGGWKCDMPAEVYRYVNYTVAKPPP